MTDGASLTAPPDHRPSIWSTLTAIPSRLTSHNSTVMAAGVAFYGLLALVPTLVAVVSVYGLVNQGNEEEIADQVESAAGSLDDSTQEFVQGQLESIISSDSNGLALVIGLAVALWSASGAVQKLMTTVALAYEATEERAGWKVRLLAYGLTAGAVVGVVLMVVVVGIIPAVLGQVELGGAAEAAIRILQLPVFALLFAGGLTVLYRYGPDRDRPTPWWNPGAVVATVVWVLFAVAFSIYSSNVGAMPASYGLLGTVAALMIFLQLTALSVIVGAEFNAEWEAVSVTGVVSRQRAQLLAEGAAGSAARPVGLAAAAAGLILLFLIGRNEP